MSAADPTDIFNSIRLVIETIPTGKMFHRLYSSRFPDALGFGKSPSRFSDPRRRLPANRFGVLYLGESLDVCFVEAILRDKRNGAVGDYPLDYRELTDNIFASIRVASPLRLVDLRGAARISMGVPSDVIGASRQTLSRRWSQAFYEHPEVPDGIIYPSRLTQATNVAVYDRAVGTLSALNRRPLKDAPGLPALLGRLRVAIDPATLPLHLRRRIAP